MLHSPSAGRSSNGKLNRYVDLILGTLSWRSQEQYTRVTATLNALASPPKQLFDVIWLLHRPSPWAALVLSGVPENSKRKPAVCLAYTCRLSWVSQRFGSAHAGCCEASPIRPKQKHLRWPAYDDSAGCQQLVIWIFDLSLTGLMLQRDKACATKMGRTKWSAPINKASLHTCLDSFEPPGVPDYYLSLLGLRPISNVREPQRKTVHWLLLQTIWGADCGFKVAFSLQFRNPQLKRSTFHTNTAAIGKEIRLKYATVSGSPWTAIRSNRLPGSHDFGCPRESALSVLSVVQLNANTSHTVQ